jgi:hypothetical protein
VNLNRIHHGAGQNATADLMVAPEKIAHRSPASASLPVSYRPYLPRDWAEDAGPARQGGSARGDRFRTKPEIALESDPRGARRWAAGRACVLRPTLHDARAT